MKTESFPPPPEGGAYTSPAVLGLSIRQLRDWEASAAKLLVVCPKSDDETWDDTELDCRRTVL